MNAQAQQPHGIEIAFRVSLRAAEMILEGLEHLPIREAGGLYTSLQAEIDKAKAKAIAGETSPVPVVQDNPSPPQEPT